MIAMKGRPGALHQCGRFQRRAFSALAERTAGIATGSRLRLRKSRFDERRGIEQSVYETLASRIEKTRCGGTTGEKS
jgi:hypothetical protein